MSGHLQLFMDEQDRYIIRHSLPGYTFDHVHADAESFLQAIVVFLCVGKGQYAVSVEQGIAPMVLKHLAAVASYEGSASC